jgi:hypothetical protein
MGGRLEPSHLPLPFQQLAEEPCGRPPIAPGLHEDVEDVAVRIDGTPQILLTPPDLDEQLVQIPGVALAGEL